MRVVVLGDVGVVDPEHGFRAVGGQQGDALAALVAAHPAAVSDDELVETLWGDEVPSSARNGLRVVAYRLRQKLDAVGVPLVTEGVGYRLDVDSSAIDLGCFQHEVDEARSSLASGDAASAAASLGEALARWRGTRAFGLHERTDRLRIAAAEAEQRRLEAEDLLVEAQLAAGDATGAAAVASRLAEEQPLRERRWELLAAGLLADGRRAEALQAVERAASLLADELGVDPGPVLAEVQAGVLAHRRDEVLAAVGVDVTPTPSGPPPSRSPAPVPSSSFVGRDHALEEVERALERSRLVTVVAPGGAGKTRLAAQHVSLHPDLDVEWVDLAPLAPGDVLLALADRFELRADARQVAIQVADVLADRHGLVVLDNCEHVLDDAAALAEAIVRRCPDLSVLATSRAPLGCESEARVDLRPLEVVAAVDLLVERAFGADGPPALDEDELIRLVLHLDALPLAIELAAPLLRDRAPSEILDALATGVAALEAPRRSDVRHRRLGDTVDWSLALQSPGAVEVFEALSTMSGPFTRVEAAALVGRDVDAELAALVEHSLVAVDRSSGVPQLRLLETLRMHGWERLARRDELDHWRDRHAATYRALAEEWSAALWTPEEVAAGARIQRSLDQFRAAFRHAVERDDVETAAALAVSLQRWFEGRRYYHEVAWALEVVEHRCADQVSDRPTLLSAAAAAAWYLGDFERARALVGRTLREAEEAGVAPPCAVHQVRFRVAANLRENDEATDAIMTWAFAAIEAGDDIQTFEAVSSMATGSAMIAAYDSADDYARQVIDQASARGNPTWLAVGHWSVALARYARLAAEGVGGAGDATGPDGLAELEIVLADFEEGARLAASVGNVVVQGWCDDMVIGCLRRLGRRDEAIDRLRALMHRWRNRPVTTHLGLNQELKELVMVLADEGRTADAARIARARRALPSDALMVPGDEVAIDEVEAALGDLCPPGTSVDVIAEALAVLEP